MGITISEKQAIQWPYGYMTQNAKHIYQKLVDNVPYPFADVLYDADDLAVDLYDTVDTLFRDIANYLDQSGVEMK